MLPAKYNWLNKIGPLPRLVATAIQYLGIKEVPGKGSNPIILNMAKQIGLANVYTDDDISWCAVFINFICFIAKKPLSNKNGDIYNLMRANSFTSWGVAVEIKDIQLGDIVVLSREGGFHVIIALAKTKSGNIIGIGGNQSNMVSIAEFDVKRAVAARRFYATAAPASVKQYIVDDEGKLSTNEA